MKISVFCPTRKRKDMLCRGIDSLIENAKDVSNIEFIFRFDDDDEDTINQVVDHYDCKVVTIINISNEFKWGNSDFKLIVTYSKKHDTTMKYLVGKRHGYTLLNRCNDETMFASEGEYLFHWTDDFQMKNNDKYDGWDTIIREGQGQNYIFFFRDGIRSGKVAVGPIGIPKKWFEINNRLCPNVLDDWWYVEICKVLPEDVRVVVDWEVDHHNVWRTGAMDETSKQGREEFNRDREKNADGYEYYSEDELLNIKKYIESNPNTKKTSQQHDNSLVGQGFFKGIGASGRWN